MSEPVRHCCVCERELGPQTDGWAMRGTVVRQVNDFDESQPPTYRIKDQRFYCHDCDPGPTADKIETEYIASEKMAAFLDPIYRRHGLPGVRAGKPIKRPRSQ